MNKAIRNSKMLFQKKSGPLPPGHTYEIARIAQARETFPWVKVGIIDDSAMPWKAPKGRWLIRAGADA